MGSAIPTSFVLIDPDDRTGQVHLPPQARGFVIFAHGSGLSRLSPRNLAAAEQLGRAGLGSLLFDLLTAEEAEDRRNVFDIPLLADRVVGAIDWTVAQSWSGGMRLGLFGASTGAAAALVAAASRPRDIQAVVSRGGRPDLAGDQLPRVKAPTLFIVGGADTEVLDLNSDAADRLTCPHRLVVVPAATHLFEEPGALAAAVNAACARFLEHLPVAGAPR